MPDVIEPVVSVLSQNEIVDILNLEEADLVANPLVQLGLYTNAITPGPSTTLGDLTEATFGGYARATIATWNGPFVDQLGNAYLISDLVVFTCDGTSGQGIVGSFLAKNNGGTQAVATNPGNAGAYHINFTVTTQGTLYQQAPTVRLTGATGAGATAHAIIDGAGHVIDIVLDDPGSGYTTYVVVIDPPQSLVATNPFPASVNMSSATDALPTTQQLTIPPIAA